MLMLMVNLTTRIPKVDVRQYLGMYILSYKNDCHQAGNLNYKLRYAFQDACLSHAFREVIIIVGFLKKTNEQQAYQLIISMDL